MAQNCVTYAYWQYAFYCTSVLLEFERQKNEVDSQADVVEDDDDFAVHLVDRHVHQTELSLFRPICLKSTVPISRRRVGELKLGEGHD